MMSVGSIFKSKTVWMVVLMFLTSGIDGIREYIPVAFQPLLTALLGLLAVYFRVNPTQKFLTREEKRQLRAARGMNP